jgi:hypothetical protein
VGANKISGGKLTKGSPEMKAHMARIRGLRKGKGMQMEGGNVFDKLGRDIKNGFNRTFNPKLGREIKSAFESKPAREFDKGLSRGALALGSSFTGLPLGLAQGEIDRQIDGASIKRRYKKTNLMVEGGTLVGGVPSVMRMENHPMIRHGGVMKKFSGKGFTSSRGTHYGGSFMSPTSGGSFASAGGSMMSP